jgi:hypothetical protein
LAETRFGVRLDRPAVAPDDVAALLLDEAVRGPELWHQKAFLAHVVSAEAEGGFRDDGILPLVAFLDDWAADGAAMTIEADGSGAIYPVVYVRSGGTVREVALPGHPLLDFESDEHRRALADALSPLIA